RLMLVATMIGLSAAMVGCVASTESDAEGSDTQPEQTSVTSDALTGGPGWHYVAWSQAGIRPWNPQSCGGTIACTVGPGTWVYWAGSGGGCCGTGLPGDCTSDVYVHYTPCGSGYIRADALH